MVDPTFQIYEFLLRLIPAWLLALVYILTALITIVALNYRQVIVIQVVALERIVVVLLVSGFYLVIWLDGIPLTQAIAMSRIAFFSVGVHLMKESIRLLLSTRRAKWEDTHSQTSSHFSVSESLLGLWSGTGQSTEGSSELISSRSSQTLPEILSHNTENETSN